MLPYMTIPHILHVTIYDHTTYITIYDHTIYITCYHTHMTIPYILHTYDMYSELRCDFKTNYISLK